MRGQITNYFNKIGRIIFNFISPWTKIKVIEKSKMKVEMVQHQPRHHGALNAGVRLGHAQRSHGVDPTCQLPLPVIVKHFTTGIFFFGGGKRISIREKKKDWIWTFASSLTQGNPHSPTSLYTRQQSRPPYACLNDEDSSPLLMWPPPTNQNPLPKKKRKQMKTLCHTISFSFIYLFILIILAKACSSTNRQGPRILKVKKATNQR